MLLFLCSKLEYVFKVRGPHTPKRPHHRVHYMGRVLVPPRGREGSIPPRDRTNRLITPMGLGQGQGPGRAGRAVPPRARRAGRGPITRGPGAGGAKPETETGNRTKRARREAGGGWGPIPPSDRTKLSITCQGDFQGPGGREAGGPPVENLWKSCGKAVDKFQAVDKLSTGYPQVFLFHRISTGC